LQRERWWLPDRRWAERDPAVTALLIHVDPEWPMPGFGGTVSPRRLRVWRTDTGAVWVVITERGAGTSITNVADVWCR